MKKELDEKLCKDFPLLFADRFADMRTTAMCWGFDVGDGWEPIIRKAAEKIEPLIKKWIEEYPDDKYHPRASQIKEKFGTLRFYLSHGTDAMHDAAHEAEAESKVICEQCGNEGKVRGGEWIVTLCDPCLIKRRGHAEEVEDV